MRWAPDSKTQSANPDFNETNTNAARYVGLCCGRPGCGKAILHQPMQVKREGMTTCQECYNSKYRHVESVRQTPITKKQFQRLSQAEYTVDMEKADPAVVRMTRRAAENPRRTEEEVQVALQKLEDRELDVVKASLDYVATIGKGKQGFYCCRSSKPLTDVKVLRILEVGEP